MVFIFPAVIMKRLYDRVFGEHLITKKSWFVLLGVSLALNLICLGLLAMEKEFYTSGLALVFLANFGGFVIANALGDWVSLYITRRVVNHISETLNPWYVGLEVVGIALGYLATMLVAAMGILLVVGVLGITSAERVVDLGVGGAFLVPPVLLMFAYSDASGIFIISAALAVFSIALPTLLYMLLTVALAIIPYKKTIYNGILRFMEKADSYYKGRNITIFGVVGRVAFSVSTALAVIYQAGT